MPMREDQTMHPRFEERQRAAKEDEHYRPEMIIVWAFACAGFWGAVGFALWGLAG